MTDMNCGVTAETTIDVGWVLNNSWFTIGAYLLTTKIYISLVIIAWFLVLFVVVGFSAVLNLTHHTVSSSGNLGVLLSKRHFRCLDTNSVCSFTAYCNRNPFVRVLQFNLVLPTCTRNMPRARIYLGILLFLFAVNLSTQGEWRISVIATPHIYTW